MRAIHVNRFLIFGLALLLSIEPVFAKKMYRMVDENGNVYFSDQIPPEQVTVKRETLNEKAKCWMLWKRPRPQNKWPAKKTECSTN